MTAEHPGQTALADQLAVWNTERGHTISAAQPQTATEIVRGWLARMRRLSRFALLDYELTPELADELLLLNIRNRRINPRFLNRFCTARLEGRYVNTGHPIVINSLCHLQDGQHRLRMIVETGLATEMDLRFGVKPEAFSRTDAGKPRSAVDVLEIEGHTNNTTAAAAIRILNAIDRGYRNTSGGAFYTLANDEILSFLENNPAMVEAARIGTSSNAPLKEGSGPIAAAAFMIIEGVGRADAEAFFVDLRGRVGPCFAQANQPMPRLRKAMEDGLLKSNVQKVAAYIFCFNAHRAGRNLRAQQQLILAPGEPFPEVIE